MSAKMYALIEDNVEKFYSIAVSYTHLTLPTMMSV